MFKVIYGKANIGGSETLILRMLRKLMNKNYEVKFYCQNIEDKILGQFQDENINVSIYGNRFNKIVLNEIKSEDILMFLGVTNFMKCKNYVRRKKIICNVLLYIVHPYTTIHFHNGIKKFIFEKSYNNMIQKEIENGSILFMDEQCLNYATKKMHLNLTSKAKENCILRLFLEPKDEPNHIEIQKKIKDRKNQLNILSVARADFPFKGYLKGLISIYSDLKKEHDNLKLTIISARQDVEILKSWITEKEMHGIKDIILILNVPYHQLEKYYKEAIVYVGMGTTILEAASQGDIAIAISPYTYECNGDCFFYQKPTWLLTEIGEGKSIKPLLEKVILSDDTTIEDMIYKTIESYNKTYDLDIFITKLISLKPTNNHTSFNGILLFYILIQSIKSNFLNRIIHINKIGKVVK